MTENDNDPDCFAITIMLGNDAMQTPEDVAVILEDLSKYMIKNGSWPKETILDLNGNYVGMATLV